MYVCMYACMYVCNACMHILGENAEKFAAEKEELQKNYDAYKKIMMDKFEKLQADLVSKSKHELIPLSSDHETL